MAPPLRSFPSALLTHRLSRVNRTVYRVNVRTGRRLRQEDVEDVGQEVALKILLRSEIAPTGRGLGAWIEKFCHYELRNAIRRLRRLELRQVELATEPVEPLPRPPDNRLDSIGEALVELPKTQRSAIEMYHFQELSFEQIARRLEVPANTVKTRYYRGLERLRRRLVPPS